MTEIPDDVMNAAYGAALDYRNDKACDPIHNDDELQLAFARAILAERERCARIAIRQAPYTQDFADATLQDMAKRIAADIRK